MNKISAVISAYNEERNIEKCLKSLSFVDEIIVVDNSSFDKTSEVVKKYTDKVFVQKNNPLEIDIQKNFGFEKASSEWILSIDADEEISKELASEIKIAVDSKSDINGYWIPRKNIIFGKWIEHSGWYPDPQLRLFKKGKGKFVKTHVHEPIKLDGQSVSLKEHIIHYNYNTVSEFVTKAVNLYVPNEGEEYIKNGYVFSYLDALRFPLNEFLSRFFARKGYKDGLHGLILSLLMAFYHLLIFTYLWEKQGFKEYGKDSFLSEVDKELRKDGKDIVYWISKEKLESIKNPIHRNLQKIKNKVRGL